MEWETGHNSLSYQVRSVHTGKHKAECLNVSRPAGVPVKGLPRVKRVLSGESGESEAHFPASWLGTHTGAKGSCDLECLPPRLPGTETRAGQGSPDLTQQSALKIPPVLVRPGEKGPEPAVSSVHGWYLARPSELHPMPVVSALAEETEKPTP